MTKCIASVNCRKHVHAEDAVKYDFQYNTWEQGLKKIGKLHSKQLPQPRVGSDTVYRAVSISAGKNEQCSI